MWIFRCAKAKLKVQQRQSNSSFSENSIPGTLQIYTLSSLHTSEIAAPKLKPKLLPRKQMACMAAWIELVYRCLVDLLAGSPFTKELGVQAHVFIQLDSGTFVKKEVEIGRFYGMFDEAEVLLYIPFFPFTENVIQCISS